MKGINMNTIKATNATLPKIIEHEIQRLGNDADLNHIDVSDVTNMWRAFANRDFNGDISKWDVSNVKNFQAAFYKSNFNGDISQWNTSKAENMIGMFQESKFNGDISQWDVSHVTHLGAMFSDSNFNGDISQWDVSNVVNLDTMFSRSPFNGDVSAWQLKPDARAYEALYGCPAAYSDKFGELHFLCKAESERLRMHPSVEAAWQEHAPMAQFMGLEGSELGRAVWTSYQASIGQAQPADDLVDMDFTMDTDWTVGCDPTANETGQQRTSQGLSY